MKQFVIIYDNVPRETMQNVPRETVQNVPRETFSPVFFLSGGCRGLTGGGAVGRGKNGEN